MFFNDSEEKPNQHELTSQAIYFMTKIVIFILIIYTQLYLILKPGANRSQFRDSFH